MHFSLFPDDVVQRVLIFPFIWQDLSLEKEKIKMNYSQVLVSIEHVVLEPQSGTGQAGHSHAQLVVCPG
jgi:hypothetical protein